MPVAVILDILKLGFTFWDRAAPIVKAGIDVTKEWNATKARQEELVKAQQAPTQQDWDDMDAKLTPHEESIQAAHRNDSDR